MEKLGFVSTLIVTFRPTDTRDAWRNDLNTHQDFKSYQFFTQKELSEQSGLSEDSITRYINGTRIPNTYIASILAGSLNCTIDDLIKPKS